MLKENYPEGRRNGKRRETEEVRWLGEGVGNRNGRGQKIEGKGRGRSRSGRERGMPSIPSLAAFSVSLYFYLAYH